MIRPQHRIAALVAVAVLAAPAGVASASAGHADTRARWHGTWGAAPHRPVPGNDWDGPNWSLDGFAAQSLRQVVRISAGGSRVRIRLSNAYGTRPLRIAGATIAKSGTGAALRPGTLRTLRFGHRTTATVPAGAAAMSDPASLPVAPLESLTVTLYFAEPTGPATFHQDGLTTTYRAAGDHRSDTAPAAFAGETSHSRYFLSGIDVAGDPRARGTVVAFGDSITDGHGSTAGADDRYPDRLAERLAAASKRLGVVNAGISGNKLLTDSLCYGEKGLARFRRDVLAQPGVRTVIVFEGINDLGTGGFPDYFGCGASPKVTAQRLIAGHRALIQTAHARGITVVGATITPMKGFQGYDTPEKEKVRDDVNHWIRTSGAYDAVADLDRALADPDVPDALRPAFDSGDHLHPNDAGANALAAAIDLATL
ncbi:SGNH/GDSL hydrolase family protein [Actinomadura soli]|uniref:SGNH/GDSL hydrolase family protein n=1 Tax=Actinomadura soli TaxID=2508997 RepID=A0A5C4JJI1_9ACTN|nr:SGNH/GDSL hydrolase family protein [Actinomadura soli]TMR06949.1 SGNH/GDSL hydrolase family protein [Actinomadura soli]